MSEAIPILLAGLGGGALAVAAREILRAVPRVTVYVGSAAAALGRAGREGSPPDEVERRRLGVVAGVGFGLAAVLLFGVGPQVLLATLGPAAATRLIGARRRRYRREVEEAVPTIAGGLADALAAGGSLRTAIGDLAPTLEGPAGVEMLRVNADLGIGAPPREALGAMRDRLASAEITALVAALLSQERSGGDLAALLRRHAAAATRRQRAAADARAATAQARLTGGMVAAMPIAAALLIELVSPGFIGTIAGDPLALGLLGAALALQLVAYLLIQRLGRVPT